MKKTTRLTSLLPLLALALILAACNIPSPNVEEQVALRVAQTQVAMTQTALAEEADSAQPTQEVNGPDDNGPEPPPEPTATHTQTPEPSATPTLTPTLEQPMVSVSVDTNCRRGPGKQYDIIGALLVGETAEVVGKAADSQYWIIQNPDRAGECWLWGNYASVTGPAAALPVYTQPPTPTPQFTWEGTWDTLNYPVGELGIVITMTTTVNGRSFSGVMNVPGMDPVLLSGTIDNDWLTVSGTYTDGTAEGTFKFYAVGINQFNGSGRNAEVMAWCGARSGAGFPDPCYKE